MTLAFIFLCGLLGARPGISLHVNTPFQSAAQPAPAAAPSDGHQQDQSAPPAESKSASPHAQTTTKPSTSTTAKRPHKKRVSTSDCLATPANSREKSTPDAKPAATQAVGGDSAQAAKSGDSSKKCPPQKIVVRQGGAAEPSIQLAGGPTTSQASDQKNAAIQLLGTTEENLKKISGRQLSSDEQETVTQIHQFMQQAKAAAANGDSERARNLAWKAELLSEDLVNPQK